MLSGTETSTLTLLARNAESDSLNLESNQESFGLFVTLTSLRATSALRCRYARRDRSVGSAAMIVALLNQKGGVGKTTLALHLAGELGVRTGSARAR